MGLVKSFAGRYWIFPETFNEKQSFVQYKHGPEVNLPHKAKLKCRLVPVRLTPSLFPDVIFLHLFFSPSPYKIFVPFCLHFRVSLLTSCLFFLWFLIVYLFLSPLTLSSNPDASSLQYFLWLLRCLSLCALLFFFIALPWGRLKQKYLYFCGN